VEEVQGEMGFEGLACYQHGLRLFDAAYRLAARLPTHERYNLADQLRRAALSVLLNIAEGYGRYHYLDKLRFFYFARGSLCETLSGFVAARQAGYIEDEQLAWVRSTEVETEKSLNGYINFIRKQQQGSTEYGHKLLREDGPEYHIPVPIDDEAPDCADPSS
jgi:four helix bundle protein